MNSSISKIHFTNATKMSLNDRFTAMTKVNGPALGLTVSGKERARTRSNSVSMMDSNRQLVEHWDRKNAMQTAMQLKNNPIRRPVRQRLQRNNMAVQIRRTMGKLAGRLQRLQRSNSFSNIATMNADRVQLQRTRGRTPSITTRLGTVEQTSRGRSMSRGRSVSRTRSTSRGRQPSLSRSNSQMDLRRAGSRESLYRAGSRTNLSRAGSRTNLSRAGSRNRLTTPIKAMAPNDARRRLNRNTALAAGRGVGANGTTNNRSRSRSRSRSRVRAAAAAAANNKNVSVGGGRARPRKRANSQARNVRSGSVNSRLGTNRTNEPVGTNAAARGGRVTKRSGSRRRRGLQNATAAGTRPGRPLKRETTTRKGAGGKAQQQAANGKATTNGGRRGSAAAAVAAGPGRRGRSRSRRANSRVRGRSASKTRSTPVKKEPKSREQLDNELDQYMANTRTLDKEMAEYINGSSARI